jgi:hypothetical protein
LGASETPASPLPLSLIELGVPSADSLSAVVLQKRKIIVKSERYFSIATFAAALKKVKVIVYARVHPNGMVKS